MKQKEPHSKRSNEKSAINRRNFLAKATGAALAMNLLPKEAFAYQPAGEAAADPRKIVSNIADALRQPKNKWSMPGLYPGVVSEVHMPGAVENRKPVPGAARKMLDEAMKSLTGAKDVRDAWRQFVSPGERIGIKFNPVGHKICGTTPEVIGAVVDSMEEAGIPRKDMVVWHRFDDAHAREYLPEKVHPGVEAYLFNWFIVKDGKNTAGGFERWDQSVFYEANVSLPDEKNILEEMFHGGDKSYYPLLLTKNSSEGGVDKVINIPVFKHHGASFITMALKNLAFGVTTNCPRGHSFIDRFISEVCAFPPVRDKVVLNVMDGLRVQYDRGPAPAPQFMWEMERLFVASDPVAMDTVGFDMLVDKQVETGRLEKDKVEALRSRHYGLAYAENLGLGVHRDSQIDRRLVSLA